MLTRFKHPAVTREIRSRSQLQQAGLSPDLDHPATTVLSEIPVVMEELDTSKDTSIK